MKEKKERKTMRHDPLETTMGKELYAQPVKKRKSKRMPAKRNEEVETRVVEPRLTKKIFQAVSDLNAEDEEQDMLNTAGHEAEGGAVGDEAMEEDDFNHGFDEEEAQYEDEEIEEISPEDEAALQAFLPQRKSEGVLLADIILAKIREKEAAQGIHGEQDVEKRFPNKVVATYKKLGRFLKKYKSGPLPKAFKILPVLSDWEELIYFANPDEWSPHAVYAATRIFVSTMSPKLAQRFLNLLLVPHVKEDLHENKKLNYHLYMALRKACFKPEAFYRGIVIPMCEEGCTYKEAYVLSSIISRQTLPFEHSGAALVKIAKLPYAGANCMIMKAILLKRYAMPLSVIDIMVEHFVSFIKYDGNLPVIWQQTLLAFAQLYKTSLTRSQKAEMFKLCRAHHHHLITPEIRKELESSPCREDLMQ